MKIAIIAAVLAAIIILGGGGAWWYMQQQALAEANKNMLLPTVSEITAPDEVGSTTPAAGGPGVSISLPKTVTVAYSAKGGFSPTTTVISRGDTVVFTAEDETSMWVGVADHPSHKKYDDTDLKAHCAEGATLSFDQCKVGASYSFTFTKSGTFGYHNHVASPQKGVIVVE